MNRLTVTPHPAVPSNTRPLGAMQGNPGAALRPCTITTLMRDESDRVTAPVPPYSRGAARRRRLHRGVELWNADRLLCAERTRRVAFLTFTLADPDARAIYGRMRDFWRKVRQTWLGTRYFCWLELQRNGRIHYHAIWLNPPHQKRANLVAWVAHHWQHGRTQVRFRQVRFGDDGLADYVIDYAKKMGRKSYQQLYDDLPRELRTFMCQRLESDPRELLEHTDHDVWQYRGDNSYRGEYQPPKLVCIGRSVHRVERGQECTLRRSRRGQRGRPRARPDPPPLDARAAARLSLQTLGTFPKRRR